MKVSSKKVSSMKVKVPSQVLSAKYSLLEGRVHKSCDQLQMLNRKISDLRVRHQRASHRGQRPFCKNLQLQLDVYQGLYNTFYTYTATQAHQLALVEAALSQTPQAQQAQQAPSA